MGIFDRIAGTLDDLTGDDGRRAARDEVDARAGAAPMRGDLVGAEAALRARSRSGPRDRARVLARSASCGRGGAR